MVLIVDNSYGYFHLNESMLQSGKYFFVFKFCFSILLKISLYLIINIEQQVNSKKSSTENTNFFLSDRFHKNNTSIVPNKCYNIFDVTIFILDEPSLP